MNRMVDYKNFIFIPHERITELLVQNKLFSGNNLTEPYPLHFLWKLFLECFQ